MQNHQLDAFGQIVLLVFGLTLLESISYLTTWTLSGRPPVNFWFTFFSPFVVILFAFSLASKNLFLTYMPKTTSALSSFFTVFKSWCKSQIYSLKERSLGRLYHFDTAIAVQVDDARGKIEEEI